MDGLPGLVSGWALGRVSLWGRIIEHEEGWRSQFAYPYALTVRSTSALVAEHVRRDYALDVDFEQIASAVLFAANRKKMQEKQEKQRRSEELARDLAAIDDRLGRLQQTVVQLHDRAKGRSWWAKLGAGETG